jgi:hypothetical protein
MSCGTQRPPLTHRVVEAAFWLLMLAVQLPTAGVMWLTAGMLKVADPFREYALALLRWRRRR